MEIKELELPGVFEITPKVFNDVRGTFVKLFHQDDFLDKGLEFKLAEQYYSTSQKGVIRGMHFQMPPHDHKKFVYCISGSVLDVILDLRKSSPTYGKACSVKLDSDISNAVYIPEGFAHGFCSLKDESCMVYNVSTVYAPESDCGIHYNSFGFNWPVSEPITNERDKGFVSLADSNSPF